jgi:hypothetical protein
MDNEDTSSIILTGPTQTEPSERKGENLGLRLTHKESDAKYQSSDFADSKIAALAIDSSRTSLNKVTHLFFLSFSYSKKTWDKNLKFFLLKI